ncbi:hypothetical protein BAUCODRAFT_236627 [Baudoinia panamericana UAMH 10762]|uniref:RNA polymerase II subunit B1 CTD phosphatase RPAP2 homolog n=1 Tax=Baudoinia panamericana (strain UAMH 10762) TaxID=717646 RepID=M2MPD4_BAUPA|nr:uncharacterized protein BAUCODRAFT_236627 [Baudoinia panamericana UAMH 10762]EMC93328.1 hypothetical protein BAUCODRAFT_236627 [Baudoinia panamericana UAMH 10762]
MATRVPVKSILKQQPAPPNPADEQKAKADKDRHNRSIALHHANLIQHRKDVELKIVKAIELLLDYPTSSTFTVDEGSRFVALVQFFQPSDYDSLVEERRIDNHCGYALCAKLPRTSTLGAASDWKVGKGAADFCSTICARKSNYVKAQLSSVPAWERGDDFRMRVELHPDDHIGGAPALGMSSSTNMQKLAQVANDEELALERGERASSFKPKQVMKDVVVERAPRKHPSKLSANGDRAAHAAIEGYIPRGKPTKRSQGVDGADTDDSDEVDVKNAKTDHGDGYDHDDEKD